MTIETSRLIARIDGELRELGSVERAVREKAYLKSDRTHYGVPVPSVRKVALGIKREWPRMERGALIGLVEALWSREIYEHKAAGVELLMAHHGLLLPGDIGFVESLIRESRTWALVDNLAEKVAGSLVERFATLGTRLDVWAVDEDFWVRRAAMLALLGPLRRGGGDFDRFGRYADAMLDETEFFIRKAIGWVLRDTGKKRPSLVFDWMLPRAARMSTVTMREAVKPLSDQQRAAIRSAATLNGR